MDKAVVINKFNKKLRWNPNTNRMTLYHSKGGFAHNIEVNSRAFITNLSVIMDAIINKKAIIGAELVYTTKTRRNTFVLTTSGNIVRTTGGESWFLNPETKFGKYILELVLTKGRYNA